MIPELLQSITSSVMRHLFTGIGTALVAQGWTSEGDWSSLLSGAILVVAGLVASIYQKWQASKNPPTPA